MKRAMKHASQHASQYAVPKSAVSQSHLKERLVVCVIALVALLMPALLLQADDTPAQDAVTTNDAATAKEPAQEPAKAKNASDQTPVKVAVLTYARGKTSQCFAPGFLTTVARHTRIVVQEEFSTVTLGDNELHQYPFVVMTGEDAFSCSEDEKKALKSYLQRGGFLLASPGCSNEPWSESFTKLIKELFPDQALAKLPMDHPVFHSIYDITELQGRKAEVKGHIDGLTLGGKLVLLFSPLGLNDTENAGGGGGCCCCGGNELKDAHRINANILAYVLTH